MTGKARTALVIGGGVAGPVAAMALRKAGMEAVVYEAYPGTADGVGGSLAIAPNGLAALRAIGAEEAVLAVARPIRRTAMAIAGRRLADQPGLPGLPPLQLLWRSELHRALHNEATARGIRIVHGKRLVGVEEAESGATALFADGSRATADILVGADGVRSTVRTLIDPAAPGPQPTGLLGFEAFSEHEVPADRETMTFAFGKRGYYLYRPAPGGGTEWGANLPQTRTMTAAEAREIPAEEWLRVLREAYADDYPGAELVRRTSVDRLQILGSLLIMPRLPHWHRGRMVLVGDSAHAPSNTSGQGASLAIESAVQLARCLRDLPDHRSAFTAYEQLRRTRVEAIAAQAAKFNRAKAPGAVARTLMPLIMPVIMKTVMAPERAFGPVQRYEIRWEQPATAAA